jgi:integrase
VETPFNAGATIKVRSDAGSRGADLATRSVSEVEVGLLIPAAPVQGGPRVAGGSSMLEARRGSETVALTWADVLRRNDRVRAVDPGQGRQDAPSAPALLSLCGDASANEPVFASRKGGHPTERAINGMRTAAKAGINEAVSPLWLLRAHGSHAIDRGASLPEVRTTLGHGNIAITSGYTHARPNTSSDLHLDPGVFLR